MDLRDATYRPIWLIDAD